MPATFVESYLFFNGRCEEAMAFYASAIGAKPGRVMRYRESPEPEPQASLPPGWGDKIIHATMRIGETTVMMSDGMEEGAVFRGFSLCLGLTGDDEVDRAFAALSAGGKAVVPPAKTFYSRRFGMLTDRFGVGWMVMVPST